MIELSNFSKSYSSKSAPAAADVSLTIADGSITGLLGPNGSGKTTIIKAICGFHYPTSGHIRMWGYDEKALPVDITEENQKAMETREFTATAGGNAISITMTGKREVKNVTINPEVVDPEDVEDLQDLIMACMNDILTQIEEANNEAVNSMTGGMNFGGLNF